MELGITQSTNIDNTKSLIRTLKYVLDILQTEEAFKVEEYKKKHTHTQSSIFFKKAELMWGLPVEVLKVLIYSQVNLLGKDIFPLKV